MELSMHVEVKVDRSRTPQQMLDATGRKQLVNSAVVGIMPKGTGDEADVYFFQVDRRQVSDEDLEKEYKQYGLVPADLCSLAQVNTNDPTFADQYPNCTHWKDAVGRWCCATFDYHNGARRVFVGCFGIDWDNCWWFAGVKPATPPAEPSHD